MSRKRDWTEDLPQLFEGYTEAEPAGLWDSVRSAMHARKRAALFWRYSTVALLAAAAVVAVLILFRPSAAPADTQPVAGELMADEEPARPAKPVAAVKPAIAPAAEVAEETKSVAAEQETVPPPAAAEPAGYSSGEVETPAGAVRRKNVQKAESVNKPELMRKAGNRQALRLMAKISGSGLMAADVRQSGQGYGYNAANVSPSIQTRSISGGPGVFDMSMIGRNRPATTEIRHRQANRYLFGLEFEFLPRWGIETGLAFTELQSVWETTTGNTVQNTERTMRYVGIPLFLHFNALKWRGLSFYLAGGPMIEFADRTGETVGIRINGRLVSSATDNSLIGDRVWSANIGAGLQLEFFEHSALFVQPGYSYHFASASAVENHYSVHPSSFNLTIGYRFLLF